MYNTKLIIVPIVAIIAVVGLEVYALYKGINGTMLGLAIMAISGLGGYQIKVLRDSISKKGKK